MAGYTLNDGLQDFYKYLDGKVLEEQRYEPSTVAAYKVELERFAKYLHNERLKDNLDGPVEVLAVNASTVKTYLGVLAGDAIREGGFSNPTIARTYSALNTFFTFLFVERRIDRNPLLDVKRPKIERVSRDFLSKEEQEAVLSASAQLSLRDCAIVHMFLITGIKLADLIALDRPDIDFSGEIIRLRDKFGNVVRTIPLVDERLKRVLREYLDSRTDDLEPLFITSENTFGNEPSRIAGRQTIHKMLEKLGRKAGLKGKKLNANMLRLTFGMNLLEKGQPDPVLFLDLMGLADPLSFKNYVANFEMKKRETLRQMSES